jgi:alanyl-tRNA synthetase
MITSTQIRKGFIDFFKQKGHTFVPSSPIVPIGDDSLLFANAGMNQFKDIFLGLASPQYSRVANTQKCLRVSGKHNDLEEVGRDCYHHTFFEMLGNWSFDDYFKAEAIEWAWELLTKVWRIQPELLWATVFEGDEADKLPRDEEAAKLWTKLTPLPAEKVLFCGRKDNFWEMGITGPCGPCSEIHIDLGEDMCDKKSIPGHKCGINNGCSRFIELWNLVFIQYNRNEEGKLSALNARYIDTGAGLERIAAVLQNKKSNYDTDLFMPIINAITDITGHKYNFELHNKIDTALRVISDHIRALVFAITDGAMPSNESRGYCVRRILRRAARFGRELGMHEPFIYRLVPVVVDCLANAFGEIKQRAEFVSTVIKTEEESFGRTLDRGIEIFNTAAERAEKTKNKTIDGEDAFALYDTYGFPLDLTQLMAAERGLKVDTEKFNILMEEQRKRAREAQKGTGLTITIADSQLPVTEDLHKYHMDSCEATILGFIDANGFSKEGKLEKDTETGIVLDKTCFYAEAGGQVGDCGRIKSNKGEFIVEATTKIANCVIHQGKATDGVFAVGDKVNAIVSKDRNAVKKNHTATHLLQWALQQVVGKSVSQQGSLVGPDYLRFDFTCPSALTAEQIKGVERLVREKIDSDEPVSSVEMDIEQARKLGAMALFGEKYGEKVRVIAIGKNGHKDAAKAFSKEFCGGTHVDRLGVIGGFKIIKEESIAAGVRRIIALTGSGLNTYLEKASEIVNELSAALKVPAESAVDRVEQIIQENKKLAKQLKNASKLKGSDVLAEARGLLEKAERIGKAAVVVGRLSTSSIEQGRAAIDMVKKKAKTAVIVFGFEQEGKAMLLAGVTDDLIKKGLSSKEIIRQIAPIVDGGGGGRAHMAQAGGKRPDKIDEALEKAAEIIKEQLANTP